MPPSIIASERCRQTFALDQILEYPNRDTCPICEVRGWLDFVGGNRAACRACKCRFFIQQNVKDHSPIGAMATLEKYGSKPIPKPKDILVVSKAYVKGSVPNSMLDVINANIVIEVGKRTFKYRKHKWTDLTGKKFPLSQLASHLDESQAWCSMPRPVYEDKTIHIPNS